MDPAQLAHEAVKRFEALQTPGSGRTLIEPRESQEAREPAEPAGEPLLEMFDQLGRLDGWAKIAMDRLAGDPADGRAAHDLCCCLEQTARLHPTFTRRLAAALADRPSVKGNLPTQQPSLPNQVQPPVGTRTP
jgi:hypothetical protein